MGAAIGARHTVGAYSHKIATREPAWVKVLLITLILGFSDLLGVFALVGHQLLHACFERFLFGFQFVGFGLFPTFPSINFSRFFFQCLQFLSKNGMFGIELFFQAFDFF